MATSGTSVFTVDRNGLISAALRRLRVLQDGATASTNQITTGSEGLNIVLKNLQTHDLIVSLFSQIQIPCQNGKVAYTIGPSGADVTTTRPLRLYDGSFIRKTISGVVTDNIDVEIWSRLRYMQQVTKAATGTISALYYQPNIDIAANLTSPGTGWGTLFVYAPTVDTTMTIFANVLRPVYDITGATQELDLPSEWFMAIVWGLAAYLADDYEVPEDRCTRLFKVAQYYEERLSEWNRNVNSTDFSDDRVREAKARDQDEKVR